MNNFCIYSKENTPRLSYVCNWIFTEVYNGDFTITSDLNEFQNASGIKVNYSEAPLPESFNIHPYGLMIESNIQEQVKIEVEYKAAVQWMENPQLPLPDLFSLVFYLLSRYEEYLDHEKDSHGRFLSNNSIVKNIGHDNHIAFLDKLLFHLAKHLTKHHSALFNWSPSYKVHKTVDVDMVYKYKGRFFERNLGAITRDILTFKWTQLIDRFKVLLRVKKDPYFVFDRLINSTKELNSLKTTFFIHCGKHSKYDKQAGLFSDEFLAFLQDPNTHLGIHPSYLSNLDPYLVKDETELLEKISGKPIQTSRQHYIKLQFPNTYRSLIECGIKEDHSMGHVDDIGYRPGTSRSFLFYDLGSDKTTELRVYPFCAMDVTLKRYLKLPIHEAQESLSKLYQNVKKYGGTYRVIFHNESLSSEVEWRGYQELFEIG